MATRMAGSFTVPAGKALVWANLNDPDVLRSCISGCQTLEKTDDTHFVATAKVKIGPFKASFKGRIELQDVDAPNGCLLVGEGEGGLAGFARGVAQVQLVEVPGGTAVTYTVEAGVGGRVAQLGGWMIDGMANRVADRFFAAFSAVVVSAETAAE